MARGHEAATGARKRKAVKVTADGFNIDPCASCGGEVVWAMTERDKPCPFDAAPSAAHGTTKLTMVDVGKTTQVKARTIMPAYLRFGRTDLRLSHFRTCPNAARHSGRAGRRHGS